MRNTERSCGTWSGEPGSGERGCDCLMPVRDEEAGPSWRPQTGGPGVISYHSSLRSSAWKPAKQATAI